MGLSLKFRDDDVNEYKRRVGFGTSRWEVPCCRRNFPTGAPIQALLAR